MREGLLVAGCWLLVAGCWLLVAGCWLLELCELFKEALGVGYSNENIHKGE